MPNIFSKALGAVQSAVDLPTPPAFAPIAGILLPESYKSDLTRIIGAAKGDFINDRKWWGELRKATGAKWEDIKKVHSNVQQAASQPRANALDAIKKYTNTPLAQKDPTLQKMLSTFGKRASSGQTKPEDLLKMQKIIASRFQKLNERLTAALEKQERLSRGSGGTIKPPPGSGETKATKSKGNQGKKPQTDEPTKPGNLSEWPAESMNQSGDMISEEILLENMFTDVVSKMSSFFASPQLTKIMAGEKYDKQRTKNLAKAAVYHLLQLVTDRAYEKLQTAGIDKKFLMKAWKVRNEPGNREILAKASKILGSDKFKPEPKSKPKPKKDPRWRYDTTPDPLKSTPGAPPVQDPGIKFVKDGYDEAVQQPIGRRVPDQNIISPPPGLAAEDDLMTPDEIPAPAPVEPAIVPTEQTPEPEKEEPVSTGAMIYRKMKSAARAAQAAGQDPVAMADYVLQRYEDAKIPEAAIVRRMFERSTGVGS